jgi:hypothetical protein
MPVREATKEETMEFWGSAVVIFGQKQPSKEKPRDTYKTETQLPIDPKSAEKLVPSMKALKPIRGA